MDFRDRIKILRKDANMTLAELATRVERSESGVRAWELGRAKPDADTIIKLAKLFGCSSDYLLGLSDIKNFTIQREVATLANEFIQESSVADRPQSLITNLITIFSASIDLNGRTTNSFFEGVVTRYSHCIRQLVSFLKSNDISAGTFSDFTREMNIHKEISTVLISLAHTGMIEKAYGKASEYVRSDEDKKIISNICLTAIQSPLETMDATVSALEKDVKKFLSPDAD